MGNANGRSGTSVRPVRPGHEFDDNNVNRGTLSVPRPLLRFHTVHGENIALSKEKTTARRQQYFFCKGLVFTDRPIEVDEVVCIKLAEVSESWSGVLRVGVTNVDPASFRDIELPKFACPDLTTKTGYWAKALSERYCIQGSVLHFFVTESGAMYYGCNGVQKGIFLQEVDITKPLWILVDVYGNTVAVELLSDLDSTTRSMIASIESRRTTQEPPPRPVRSPRMSMSPIRPGPSSSTRTSASPRPAIPIGEQHLPYKFHSLTGLNASRVSDWCISRRENEFDRGYCFLDRALAIGETVAIRIEATENAFHGGLAFGMTNCNPDSLRSSNLPADSDDLLERSEYWAVIKDVGALPDLGDILQFTLRADGAIVFSKNSGYPRPIMYMDTSVPLWPFFDVFGRTKCIRLVRPRPATSLSSSSSSRESSEGAPTRPPPPSRTLAPEIVVMSRPSTAPAPPLDIERYRQTLEQHRRHREAALAEVLSNNRRSNEMIAAESYSARSRSPRESSSDDVVRDTMEFLRSLESRSSGSATRSTPDPTAPSVTTMPNHRSLTLNTLGSLVVPEVQHRSSSQPVMSSVSALSGSSSSSQSAFSTPAVPPRSTLTAVSREQSPAAAGGVVGQSECSICWSASANAVVYRCGHVCMCMSCARQQHSQSGTCPMCRQRITDVIQLFFS